MSALERWSEEMQSAWIYRRIAPLEDDRAKARMFEGLAGAAETQAAILLGDIRREQRPDPVFTPSLRARVVVAIVKQLGVRRTRPLLAALKVRGLAAYHRPIQPGHPMPVAETDIGARHRRAGGGGNLRAAVFGVNDGLVSNTSLIMGVAGAASETSDPSMILVAGVGGLLAGAFSMAAGEYVSMRSQRELYEHQIGEERAELERYPEEESEELALIYHARGVPLDEARSLTRAMLTNKEALLETLAREELGLDPQNLGSPWGAATSSFVAFAFGACVPLAPFLLSPPSRALVWAAAGACVGLFAIGAVLSLFSGKHALLGGLRMLAIGAGAGALTYGLGTLFGTAAMG